VPSDMLSFPPATIGSTALLRLIMPACSLPGAQRHRLFRVHGRLHTARVKMFAHRCGPAGTRVSAADDRCPPPCGSSNTSWESRYRCLRSPLSPVRPPSGPCRQVPHMPSTRRVETASNPRPPNRLSIRPRAFRRGIEGVLGRHRPLVDMPSRHVSLDVVPRLLRRTLGRSTARSGG